MEDIRKSAWLEMTEAELKDLDGFSKDYLGFMDKSKTERMAVKEIIKRAEEAGFKPLDDLIKSGEVKAGAKAYAINRNKAVALFILGSKDLEEGMTIVGSHLDSPRLDLKPVPLFEESHAAYLKTHYYGGIKKYQWTNIPLSLVGVAFTKDGKKVEISIGEKDEDPVFFISELLVHLSADLNQKKAGEVIEGEKLNIMVGSIPLKDEKENPIKKNVLKYLKETYDLEEDDFMVAELNVVPATKARDVGFDRSMIMAYGHDDKVCSFASLKAILEAGKNKQEKTLVGLYVDKEEIGSVGATGMTSQFFEDMVLEILEGQGKGNIVSLKRALRNSKVLSADVTLAEDAGYLDATEPMNTAKLGHGVALTKYTGSRGKGGSNDADGEYLSEVRLAFAKENAIWQTGELGKIDQGGGGTIAYILAEYGMSVVDCGTPVVSMHAPLEVISKADLYQTYKAYLAFFKYI